MTGVATAGAAPRPGSALARRGGVLPLDKPAGITSFDAVRQVRRILGERRVGHAGTLDPTATGLLPICVGRTTRFVDYFHAQPKTYHCVVRLGERSDTGDTEGVVTPGGDASALDASEIRTQLERLTGEIAQIPPMHSAVRHEGRHLYELARAGEEVVREPRRVTIHSAELVDFRPGAVAEIEIIVVSGKGAYMRVLASDLGDALGTGGLLGWLSRTSYGTLELAASISLDALAAMDDPWPALLPPEVAVAHLPQVNLGPAQVQQVRRGQSVWLPRTILPDVAGECRIHDPSGELVGIGELNGGLLRPTKVLTA
ncbi:MAG TPA: tRNA pseudouridine(55) synthase TruB [Candidatus Dormibacteraeota bacterium]